MRPPQPTNLLSSCSWLYRYVRTKLRHELKKSGLEVVFFCSMLFIVFQAKTPLMPLGYLRDFVPASSAWWVLFSRRRAHNVSSKENHQTHPKCSRFCRKTCSEELPDFQAKPARKTWQKSVPARILTTVIHF